ncbi:MAG TPA: zinc ribbon domain-containing protein [Dehalococcoidia bacterium]|nr:zinc ribbon domain-containing protein [Dehalococcoidia bacterium]
MSEEPDRAAELGRKLGRAVRAAKPRAKRLSEEAKPRVEKAGNDVLRFAREHESEVKQVAKKIVRARLTGPLGLVFDALATETSEAADTLVCNRCQTANASGAKFCSQCGVALESTAPPHTS